MSAAVKFILATIILVVAIIFNFLDLLSFDSKFSIHPYLYGPVESWLLPIEILRKIFLIALGPALILALFIKTKVYRLYLPIFTCAGALIFVILLKYLELNYTWKTFVVPQINIEKIGKVSVGPNDFIEVKICNNSKYTLNDLNLKVIEANADKSEFSPVLDETGGGYESQHGV